MVSVVEFIFIAKSKCINSLTLNVCHTKVRYNTEAVNVNDRDSKLPISECSLTTEKEKFTINFEVLVYLYLVRAPNEKAK